MQNRTTAAVSRELSEVERLFIQLDGELDYTQWLIHRFNRKLLWLGVVTLSWLLVNVGLSTVLLILASE